MSEPKIVGEVDEETVAGIREIEESILDAADQILTAMIGASEAKASRMALDVGVFALPDGRRLKLGLTTEWVEAAALDS